MIDEWWERTAFEADERFRDEEHRRMNPREDDDGDPPDDEDTDEEDEDEGEDWILVRCNDDRWTDSGDDPR